MPPGTYISSHLAYIPRFKDPNREYIYTALRLSKRQIQHLSKDMEEVSGIRLFCMITLVDEDGISSVVRTISSMQPFIAEDWKIRDQGVYPIKKQGS